MLDKLTKYLPVAALAIIVFSLYFSTLDRAIYLEDSAEFVTGAATLSIVHPSGYPSYLLLGKLFSYLPLFDNAAARINFLSLLFALAAVVILYQSLKKLFKNTVIACALSFLFAIAPMVWLQATYAEVYSLNTFFLTSLLWLYLYWREKPANKRLYLLLFAYGLSLTNHFLMLPLAPLILIWLFCEFPPRQKAELYPKLVAAWTAGLAPYLYIPIRALGQPAFSWFSGNTEKLLTYNLATGHAVSWSTLRYLSDMIYFLRETFGWPGLIFLAAGLLLMLYNRAHLRWLTLGSLFLFSLGLIIAITGGNEYTKFAAWFYRYLYVPLLLSALLPTGYLLAEIYRSRFRLALFYPLLLALLAWPTAQLGERLLANDRSGFIFLERYTNTLLESLPKSATIFVHHDYIVNDNLIFGLSYQRYIKNTRPDVKIWTLTSVFMPPDDFPVAKVKKIKKQMPVVEKYLAERRGRLPNLYATAPLPGGASNGFAYRLSASGDKKIKQPPVYYVPDNLYFPAGEDNPFYQTIMAKWHYDQAARLYAEGKVRSGQWFLIKAIEYDPDPNSEYYQSIIALRQSYNKKLTK